MKSAGVTVGRWRDDWPERRSDAQKRVCVRGQPSLSTPQVRPKCADTGVAETRSRVGQASDFKQGLCLGAGFLGPLLGGVGAGGALASLGIAVEREVAGFAVDVDAFAGRSHRAAPASRGPRKCQRRHAGTRAGTNDTNRHSPYEIGLFYDRAKRESIAIFTVWRR
jgi:hypothetical protein